MPLKRTWRCPFCTGTSMMSPRHWNVQRHIRLMHGLTGEPVDHLTGLTRFQLQCRIGMDYGYGNFQRSASSIYQPREKRLNDLPPSYPYNISSNYDDDKYDREKKAWEVLDKMKDLKILEALKEIRENSARLVQQNILIISQLTRIINAGRF